MGKHAKLSKVLAVVLSLCICMSATAFMSLAYDESFVSETHEVFSRTTSTIAPGVTQEIVYAYANDGKQMAYYVATADITRDDVNVYANYKNNQCTEFGMAKLTEQIAAAQLRNTTDTTAPYYNPYYTVVAGVNADFYNMNTGRPSGAFVMEGTITNNANNRPFFAILDDGTPVIGKNNTDWDAISDRVVEAVGGSQLLVKDGKDVTATVSGSYNTDRHCRTCVGYTADGKVVMMSLDGRQEPFSCGGSMHELAQIMLEAGCVAAINLDGGGSTTFAARQEGENEISIVNRPSDGSERAISSSLLIVSTTPPSDVFDRAVLTAENSYVTPGSTVKVAATGVSPAGTAAEIPADAEWKLADASLGTVENGVFVSNGTVGEAEIQVVYNDKVVGSVTINVVIPEIVAFSGAEMVVPYGKTVPLEINATYGLNKVAYNEDDFRFELSDSALGTIDGMNYTACGEGSSLTEGKITAVFAYDESLIAEVALTLGKGSNVVADFENGLPGDFSFSVTNNSLQTGKMYHVNESTGKVHSGNGAVALEVDFSQINAPVPSAYSGFNFINKNLPLESSVKSVGFWFYLPELEEIAAVAIRVFVKGVETGKSAGYYFINEGEVSNYEHNGWHYYSLDLTSIGDNKTLMFAIQIYNSAVQGDEGSSYYIDDYSSQNSKYTFYVDDITLDYSSAVEDRELPEFEYVRTSYGTLSDAVDVKGQTIDSNIVSVTARAVEDTTKSNYSGLDLESAKVYVDGNQVKSGVSVTDTGIITLDDVTLSNGTHTFKFEISDKAGNLTWVERQLTIDADSSLTNVSVVPADETLDRIAIGSVYWMNIETSAIENIQSVTTELNLNSVNTWELDYMDVAEGFTAEYTIDEVTNNATITITRTGENTETGNAVLASLPIRTWESTLSEKNSKYTPEYMWTNKIVWPIDIKLEANLGTVEFVDGSEGSFSMAPFAVDTELYAICANMEDYSEKTRWHKHNAVAVDDKDATCTEPGYAGRTFCEECNSVVEWGTVTPATGHSYEITDGVLKCACGKVYNGEYEGKLYIDGIAAEGWVEDSYYVDGVALTGIQFVDDLYYDFGEDGVSKGKYNGLYDNGENIYYIGNGVILEGWRLIGDDYWFFSWDGGAAADGEALIDGYNYKFVDHKLVEGEWINDGTGIKYMWAGRFVKNQWFDLNGNTYYFGEYEYASTGLSILRLGSNSADRAAYMFTDEGVLVERIMGNGLKTFENGAVYLENDVATYAGLVQDADGNYYYINSSLQAVKNRSYVIGESKANGLLPAGTYEFGADGKMLNPPVDEPEEPVTKNGLVIDEDGEIRYYVDGEATYAGVVADAEGNLYYINSTKKAVKNCTYKIGAARTNGLCDAGTYEFGADGKMIIPESVKNGLVVDEDGEIRYYVNNEATYAGVVADAEGNLYYINSTKKAVKNCTYKIGASRTNGLCDAGTYEFGADGKMIIETDEPDVEVKNGLVVDEDGEIRYYVDGEATYAGVVADAEGNLYYINSTKKAVKNCTYKIGAARTNGLCNAGTYEFGADGKMIIA